MAGIPIQVIRTYDSRDKRKGDFGVGWTLDSRNARVQRAVSRQRLAGHRQQRFPTKLCIVATRPHIVTITMPTNEVYKFEATLGPSAAESTRRGD